jgi:hypothetical protein
MTDRPVIITPQVDKLRNFEAIGWVGLAAATFKEKFHGTHWIYEDEPWPEGAVSMYVVSRDVQVDHAK